MPKLGSLYYELLLKDLTDRDLQAIEKKLQNLSIELDTKKLTESLKKSVESYKGKDLSLGVKTQYLHDSIRAALKQPEFPIKVRVEAASAQDAVREALRRAGLQRSFTADDKRFYDAETKRNAAMQVAAAKAASANALAQQRLARAHNIAESSARKHASATVSLNSAMRSNIQIAGELGPALASAYSVVALKNFMQHVIDIGGELEKQKLAMGAILGDEGFADKITNQINSLAVKSPFGVMELNQYTKQLTAFQIPYNELYDTMKRMTDISAATGTDMGRIILAFGQIRAATVLKGTEARQLTEANIPIYDMLSKYYTKIEGQMVSVGEVMDRMSKKEIPFQDVKDVLWELTDEGGKFYNMQEVLSESMQAKWKNLSDAIDLMFADIAKSTSGPLKSLAEILTVLMKHWRLIAAEITAAALAFGTVKVLSLLAARSLDASGTAALKSASNAALLERRNLRLAQSYRTLTAEEQKVLSTSIGYWRTQSAMLKSLNADQFRQLALTGRITKAEWERMIALGRLNKEQRNILSYVNHVSGGLQGLSAVEQNNIKHLGLLRRSFLGVGNAMRSVGRAMMSLAANPMTWAMAAIGAVTALWQRNEEEQRRAVEAGKEVEKAAAEASKNLGAMVSKFSIPTKDMKAQELAAGIEEMEGAIKDYSQTPLTDITDTLVNQQGEVASLTERYDMLLAKVKEIKDANDIIRDDGLGGGIAASINAAGGGWFEDDLLTDLKDYSVASVKGYDAVSKMTGLDYATVKRAEDELLNETEKTLDSLERYLKQKGWDIANLTKEQQRAITESFRTILMKAEDATDEARELVMQKLYDRMGVDMQYQMASEEIISGVLEKMRSEIGKVDPEMAKVVRHGGKLNEAMQEKFEEAFKNAIESLKQDKPELENQINELIDNLDLTPIPIQVMLQTQAADEDWKRQLDQAYGFQYTAEISQAKTVEDARKAIAEAAEEAQKMADATDAIKLNVDFEFKSPSLGKFGIAALGGLAGVSEEQLKGFLGNDTLGAKVLRDYDEAMAKVNARIAGDKATGLNTTPTDKSKNGGKGNKDAVAEQFKQRFKDIKDAWSEFQKWSKTEGRKAAATRIGESGLFSTLSSDKIPQTVEQYRALVVQLENELRKAGTKGHSQRESLLNELLKQLLDIDKTIVDEQLKLALDKVSKEAERQLADWNLFDKIRKATGNQDLAMSIAFGMNADATTDYPTLVKDQFAKLAKEIKGVDITFDNTTLKQAKDLGDDIAKSYQDTASKLEKYAREQKDAIADILSEYQSLQDKLTKIDADRDRKIKTVRESDMSAPDKAKYIQRINVEADYQKFTQSNEYLQFFAGIYALTEQEATRIGDLIEQNLNRRLQAGTISAENYYKEIERVRQQLDKLRNVKSDALTFMTGGVKGLNDKRQEANDAARLQSIQKIAKLEEEITKAKAEIKGFDDAEGHSKVMQLENQLNLTKEELSIQNKIREKLIRNQQQWQNILDVANIAANIAGGLSDAFSSIRDMADAYGVDTESNGWLNVEGVLDTLSAVTSGVSKVVQSAMSGDIGGIIGGVVSTITSPFTIWSKLHDKKLQKMIERSKEAAQIMQNQYEILEKRMANFLGNAANMKVEGYDGEGGAYGKQLELMKGQLAELEKQRQAELDKKKTDDSVVEDYNKQIEEMKISIRDFAVEAANAIYGIDLNGWAQQIGDALVDAFAKGEDAAEAFDKTVADIMRSVVKSIIATEVIAPAMEHLRDYLFGENGVFANYKTGGDFKLSAEDAVGLANELNGVKDEIAAAKEIWDLINGSLGGMLDDTDKAKSGLTAGIQSITEDTADLLASYLNSVRASTSMIEQYELASNEYSRMISEVALPRLTTISESQLRTQEQIAANTLLNAKMATEIRDILKRNINGGGNFRIS